MPTSWIGPRLWTCRRPRPLAARAASLAAALFVGSLVLGLPALARVTAAPPPSPVADRTTAATSSPSARVSPSPTQAPPPYVEGRHVYDFGKMLDREQVTAAGLFAGQIENKGGGRVAVYTSQAASKLPDAAALAESWGIDGMLVTASTAGGSITLGSTLSAKLSPGEIAVLAEPRGPQSVQGWVTSSLARAWAFVSGLPVSDGARALGQIDRGRVEAAARELSSRSGKSVYIDVAVGGDDASAVADFNGMLLSRDLRADLVVAVAVSGQHIEGRLYAADGLTAYKVGDRWVSGVLSIDAPSEADVSSELLSAVLAVQPSPPAGYAPTAEDIVPVTLFAVLLMALSVLGSFHKWRRTAPGPDALVLTATPGAGYVATGDSEEILAVGRRGQAVVVEASPTGKVVRDVDPGARATHLDDSIWLFTADVTLRGAKPFRAVFGHRVPQERENEVEPGTTLAVAVGRLTARQEVAIDWRSSSERAEP